MVPKSKTTSVRLNKPQDWTRWFRHIKIEATELGVWEYIDPKGKLTLERPERPQPHPDLGGLIERLLPPDQGTPSSTSTASRNTAGSESSEAERCSACGAAAGKSPGHSQTRQPLSKDERDNLKLYLDIPRQRQSSDYAFARQTFNDRQKDINIIKGRVRNSIAPHYIPLLDTEPTLRGKLKALSSQARPLKPKEREYATQAFKKLIDVNTERVDIAIWTAQVTDAYILCEEADAVIARDHEAVDAVISVVESKFPYLVFDWMNDMNDDKEVKVPAMMESIRLAASR